MACRNNEASIGDSLFVNQTGGSNLDLTQRTAASVLAVSGNATLVVRGETGLLKLDTKGFSKSILNGKAPVARYVVGAATQVNAVSLENARSFVEASGIGASLPLPRKRGAEPPLPQQSYLRYF